MSKLNINWVRKQFPFFTSPNKEFIYFDNSSATLKLKSVIEIVNQYNTLHPTNLHSHEHKLGKKTKLLVDKSRQIVADFINCQPQEVTFTYNTTSGLDSAAKFIGEKLKPGDTILLSPYAHGSNLLPWVEVAKAKNLNIRFIKVDHKQKITEQAILAALDDSVKAIAIELISNSFTYKTEIEKVAPLLKAKGIFIVIDAAQSVLHLPTDVLKLHADFLAFSGYKMFATTGIGVLYINKAIINKFKPLLPGGFQFKNIDLTTNEVEYKADFLRHEPSTANVEGILALAKAISFIQKIGISNIHAHEKALVKYALSHLQNNKHLQVLNHDYASCNILLVPHNQKVTKLMNYLTAHNICVKSGDFGAPLLSEITGQKTMIRISFSIYNSLTEVKYLIKILNAYHSK